MEAYGWSFENAMSKTLPQIILITHASHVSGLRMKAKSEADTKSREKKKKKDEENPIVYAGKTLDNLTSEEQAAYWGGFGQ